MTHTYFFCYKKCSTCRSAQKHLDSLGISYTYREITEETPTVAELKQWIAASKLPLKRFFNTSGNVYRELNLKERFDTLSEDALITLLSENGMLIKRPLLVHNDHVTLGYKAEVYDAL